VNVSDTTTDGTGIGVFGGYVGAKRRRRTRERRGGGRRHRQRERGVETDS
jgi:hypothetical protein